MNRFEGKRVIVYLNGQLELNGPLAKMFTTNHLFAATRSDAMFPLQGQLRDLAIYDKLLTSAQIAEHFQASAVV